MAWTLAISFAYFFNCGSDADAQWTGGQARCDNSLQFENAVAISDFITDCLVFLLPIPMVRDIRVY